MQSPVHETKVAWNEGMNMFLLPQAWSIYDSLNICIKH